ncbi:MAG: extensin family protein [Rhodobacterales bacterium]|nr:extensin family protein [Rhodobacterales bacterium]
MFRWAACVVLLVAGVATTGSAQTAEPPVRPEARPVPEAPMRPEARPEVPATATPAAGTPPAEAMATATATPPANATAAVTTAETAPPRLRPEPRPGSLQPATETPPDPGALAMSDAPAIPTTPLATVTDEPVVTSRQAATPQIETPLELPLATPGDAPLDPLMDGPRQMIMAEAMMQDPPAPPVFVDRWTGDSPPLRPGTPETVTDPGGSNFLSPDARSEEPPSIATTSVRVALRPRLRPEAPVDPAPLVATAPDSAPVYNVGAQPGVAPEGPQFSPLAVARALRPEARSNRVLQQASATRRETVRGSICGNPDIQGEVLASIGSGGGCGIAEPVLVRSVSGVRLSTPGTMDCRTAAALNAWVNQAAVPALRGYGGGLVGLDIMGTYACRPRNNQAGQRLSEHGRGRAIDIGGFILASGNEITVLRGWGTDAYGGILRAMHRAACGPFGTVLGPNANSFHRNHFHFDTASYNNGAYCR